MKDLPFLDKVWVDIDHKLEGIRQDVAAAAGDRRNVVVVAHFEETLVQVEAALRAGAIDFRRIVSGESPALCSVDPAGPRVWLTLAANFPMYGSLTTESSEEERLHVLVVEHHPMGSADEALVETVSGLQCRSRIIFHLALTDPLMSHFGGDKVINVVTRMGGDESFISHSMISTAIRRAQHKIEKHVRQEIEAQSAEEWFRYNLPGMR